MRTIDLFDVCAALGVVLLAASAVVGLGWPAGIAIVGIALLMFGIYGATR